MEERQPEKCRIQSMASHCEYIRRSSGRHQVCAPNAVDVTMELYLSPCRSQSFLFTHQFLQKIKGVALVVIL